MEHPGELRMTISAAIFSAIVLLGCSTSSREPLGVCRVLSELDTFRGKIVTHKGVVIPSHLEGSALYDSPESPCHTFGTKWPAGLYLVWPNDSNPEDGPRNFRPNTLEIEKNYRKVAIQAQKEGKLVLAIFVGELRARKGIQIFPPRKEATYGGNGYGNLGQYPAQ
jgi:hypothetical protein